MSWLQIAVLAIVQGLTEFLPISSSGHLVLVPSVFAWGDPPSGAIDLGRGIEIPLGRQDLAQYQTGPRQVAAALTLFLDFHGGLNGFFSLVQIWRLAGQLDLRGNAQRDRTRPGLG